MGYDANEDTYATSCDEFSDSESELSSVEMLFRGYEPKIVVLDGSDHVLFAQIDELIKHLRASKLIQQIRVSTAFLQGLDHESGNKEADDLFDAIAGLAPICEIFICHLHRHLPRETLEAPNSGLLKCVRQISHLTLNNFLLTDDLIAALGENPELTELRAYFDSHEEANGLDPLFLALAQSPRLKTLDVYAREDERPEKPRRVTGTALKALCRNKALQEWKLWHLDTDLLTAVAEGLSTTDTELKRLSFATCFAKTEGYVALANMLKVNTSLTHLHISDIVSADACVALAQGLKDNSTLQELELTYESDSDKVGQAMVDMLQTNTTLKQLKLYMSYSFENDMSFSAIKGTEYEEQTADPQQDWDAQMDQLLQQNRDRTR